MADDKPKRRRIKKTETIRERAARTQDAPAKPRRIKKTASAVGKPLKKARDFGRKEYYLPLPDNKVGRFLNKRRRIVPKFIREAWQELRHVTWPNRKETAKMTFAVIMFALVFGVLIAIVDFGLEKLFREVIIK